MKRKLVFRHGALMELRAAHAGGEMVSTIIYLLGFLTVGLVAGVFVIALIGLNEIDGATNHSEIN